MSNVSANENHKIDSWVASDGHTFGVEGDLVWARKSVKLYSGIYCLAMLDGMTLYVNSTHYTTDTTKLCNHLEQYASRGYTVVHQPETFFNAG